MFPKNLFSKSVLLVSIAAAAPAFAETIAVIGTGRLGGALGPKFATPDIPSFRVFATRTGGIVALTASRSTITSER